MELFVVQLEVLQGLEHFQAHLALVDVGLFSIRMILSLVMKNLLPCSKSLIADFAPELFESGLSIVLFDIFRFLGLFLGLSVFSLQTFLDMPFVPVDVVFVEPLAASLAFEVKDFQVSRLDVDSQTTVALEVFAAIVALEQVIRRSDPVTPGLMSCQRNAVFESKMAELALE